MNAGDTGRLRQADFLRSLDRHVYTHATAVRLHGGVENRIIIED